MDQSKVSLKIFRVLLFVSLLSAGITLFAQGKMITIPSTTYEVEDSRIGISLTVSISSFDISSTEMTQRGPRPPAAERYAVTGTDSGIGPGSGPGAV